MGIINLFSNAVKHDSNSNSNIKQLFVKIKQRNRDSYCSKQLSEAQKFEGARKS